MTDSAVFQVLDPSIVIYDSVFSFETSDWIDAPTFVTELPETSPETNLRIFGEKEYRDNTISTHWRYRWFYFRFPHGKY
jgi:hypothetical protein